MREGQEIITVPPAYSLQVELELHSYELAYKKNRIKWGFFR